jgi:putative phage-type endonuclease
MPRLWIYGEIMKHITREFVTREAWLEWRHGGIGASDAPAIAGVSRFKTRDQLLKEKALPFSGEDQSNAYIKDRGNKIEAKVLEFLEKENGLKLTKKFYELVDFPFLRASPDGITDDGKLCVEIKLLTTFNPLKPNINTEGYKKFEALDHDYIPEEYKDQCIQQMLVTGAKECMFVGYKEIKGYYGLIKPDQIKTVIMGRSSMFTKTFIRDSAEFWLQVLEERDRLNQESVKELE